MRHFNQQEWLLFGQGETSAEQERLMEDHLTVCDECMQTFLNGIDETDLNRATAIIPPDFSTRTMELIPQPGDGKRFLKQPHPEFGKDRDRWRRRLFSYYVVAASLTLMLMSAGVFQSAIRQVPNISLAYSLELPDKKNNIIFNWPTQLRKKTTGWLDFIEFDDLINNKEVR